MASLTILYWRDIPSQVIVKSGRSAAKRELSERFIRAIDAAAMHAGAKSDDAYLAEWRRGQPVPCGDDLEAEAAAAAERLEKEYDTHRLALLAKHDGREGRLDARSTPSAFEPRGKRPPPERNPWMRTLERPPCRR